MQRGFFCAAKNWDSLPGAGLRPWSPWDWPVATFQATLAVAPSRRGNWAAPSAWPLARKLDGRGRPFWFAPDRFSGAPPGCRSVLNACSARKRRRVTQGAFQARAAALSGKARVLAALRAAPAFPPPLLSTQAPVFLDGTGTASKTDHQPGGQGMHQVNPPQTNPKTMGRDAAIQIRWACCAGVTLL